MIRRYTFSDIQRAHVNGEGLPAYMVDADDYDALVAEVKEWAAYCRSCQPGPNIADTMLQFIGDPPHDYASDAGAEQKP